MAHQIPQVPKYRHYKPKNLAVVRIDGHDHYLGRHGSEESREKYRRLVAEWLAAGHLPRPASPEPPPPDPSINEILLAYWKHAQRYYRTPDGKPGREVDNIRDALRPLRKLYGSSPAKAFGPLALQAVRDEMIRAGLARTTVNGRINRIRRAFKWAVGVELIPTEVHQALTKVEGLHEGRSDAREPVGVQPVPVSHVEATLTYLTAPVAAMVRLQLLTGCRTGEVLRMRGRDLSPGEPTWEYRPASHKNAWRGQQRVIPLGPRAQEIIRTFLKPDLAAYLFAPTDAVATHHARRTQGRKSRPTPSELARRCPNGPGRKHGSRYSRRSYRQAIVRACKKAGVPAWTPLQLRHTAATAIRARYGLEAAQSVLGHKKAETTLIYAARDLARANAIMAEIG